MTKPTTIRAITEIPAKIPRPIGSTEIFFPGIWKGAGEELEDEVLSAAEAGELVIGGFAAVVGACVGDGVVVEMLESGIKEMP